MDDLIEMNRTHASIAQHWISWAIFLCELQNLGTNTVKHSIKELKELLCFSWKHKNINTSLGWKWKDFFVKNSTTLTEIDGHFPHIQNPCRNVGFSYSLVHSFDRSGSQVLNLLMCRELSRLTYTYTYTHKICRSPLIF